VWTNRAILKSPAKNRMAMNSCRVDEEDYCVYIFGDVIVVLFI
jgi:hypothetical protein